MLALNSIGKVELNIRTAKEFKPHSEEEVLLIELKVKPHHQHLLFSKKAEQVPQNWSQTMTFDLIQKITKKAPPN